MRAPDDDALIVLEGNRRLATLRLLREPGLAHRIASAEMLRITVPAVHDGLRVTFDQVSVYPVASRERARAFIGFKHINGPAKWDAYAKARFAAGWYRAGRARWRRPGPVEAAVGDRHDTVKRMVSAIYVLEQAEAKGLFDIEDRHARKFNFSHLYTALSRSQYMDYLGLEAAWRDKTRSRIRCRKGSSTSFEKCSSGSTVRNPMAWNRRADPKPRHQAAWRGARQRRGTPCTEQGRSLDTAHASTVTADTRFTASLLRAREAIRDAAGSLRAYEGQDQSLLDIADDIRETAEAVHSRMAKKRRDAMNAATDGAPGAGRGADEA